MRRRGLIHAAVALALFGLVLSGCSNSQGASLARQACTHVESSLALYASAQKTSGSARSKLVSEAIQQLSDAQPLASLAASDDTQWQALEATIKENSYGIPEGNLTYALNAQCATALS